MIQLMRKMLKPGATYRAALLLFKIDRRRAFVGLFLLTVAAILPAVFKVTTGLLVGAVPGVVRDGFTSQAGRTFLRGSALVAAVYLIQQG